MKSKIRRYSIVVSIFTGLLILTEFFMRFALGFGNPPLFERSEEYGYRFVPNQNIRRFSNHIFFNSQGLRSEPITAKSAEGVVRILCLGDSITNGGALIDQNETYPYLLESVLNRNSLSRFEVLNASAPGWSIQNEEAYLRKYGIYNSNTVLLQVGSHNLFQEKSNSDVVGRSPNFPDHKTLFALQELFVRYLPRYLSFIRSRNVDKQKNIIPEEILERNLTSIKNIAEIARSANSKLAVIYIGPPSKNKERNPLSDFGERRFFEMLNKLNLPFIDLQKDFITAGDEKLFRDKVHPNAAGNMIIAQASARLILNSLKNIGGN